MPPLVGFESEVKTENESSFSRHSDEKQ